ncbi:multidrug transporter [Photobacterium damselae]|uniref:multidrug transporter n=1 Tax=Photobacterium damselae TaxID=38293 RepID=UPI002542FA9C
MDIKRYKLSIISTSISVAIIGGSLSIPAQAQEDLMGPSYANEVTKFYDNSKISANLNFWLRHRDRAGFDKIYGHDTKKTKNLDHGSVFFDIGFNSGYIYDIVGLDIVAYTTFDMWQTGSPDHEMNFWNVNNPYEKIPKGGCSGPWNSDCNDNGVSIATANVKFKYQDLFTAKLGYYQPSVPSTMGVNWSFAPGSYLGGEIGLNFERLALGLTYASEYKAPWFKNTYKFQETISDGSHSGAGNAYSLGLNYTIADKINLNIAYGGLTKGQRKNAQLKLKATTDNGWYLSPQVYFIHDNEEYSELAYQLAFISRYNTGAYTFRAESTYSSAKARDHKLVGNFAYRLTQDYGGSNGSYDIWWNNRSDYNHDEELALFGSVARNLSDWGLNGLSTGVSGAYGFGAKAPGYNELTEYAFSLFTNYRVPEGLLKNIGLSVYCTWYYNDMNAGDWMPYTNAFQDETDFKFIVTMPFGIK